MIATTRRMAETLHRLGLYDRKEWFGIKTRQILNKIEEDLYGPETTDSKYRRIEGNWRGLRSILEEEKEEKRQASGKRVLRLGGSKGPSDWKDNQAESKDNSLQS